MSSLNTRAHEYMYPKMFELFADHVAIRTGQIDFEAVAAPASILAHEFTQLGIPEDVMRVSGGYAIRLVEQIYQATPEAIISAKV